MTTPIQRLATASFAFALLVGASACSSDEKTETGSKDSTTTSKAAAGGESTTTSAGGASGSNSGSTSTVDYCTKVPAATVAELTGAQVTTAKPISDGSFLDSSQKGPGCSYNTASGLGGVTIEQVSEAFFKARTTDPTAGLEPMSGVQDTAFKKVDAIDSAKVIRVEAGKGSTYVIIQMFSGAPLEGATELTNKVLA